MIVWHILGWATVAANVVGGSWLAWYLATLNCDSRTWLRPVPLPQLMHVDFTTEPLPDGFTDYVGLV